MLTLLSINTKKAICDKPTLISNHVVA
jgi:hypothetical protein